MQKNNDCVRDICRILLKLVANDVVNASLGLVVSCVLGYLFVFTPNEGLIFTLRVLLNLEAAKTTSGTFSVLK